MTIVDLLPLAAIGAVFWLLILRPASVRRKTQAALLTSLQPGQRIMTTAGVFGTVVALEGERLSLEIAPGVVIEMVNQAVARVVPAEEAGEQELTSASAGLLDVPELDVDARTAPESSVPGAPAIQPEGPTEGSQVVDRG